MAGAVKHAPGECCGHEVEAPEIYPFSLNAPSRWRRFVDWLRRVFL